MSEYTCPRCGYFTFYRFNMRKHLNRKRNCQIRLENVSIQECFQTVLHEENVNDNQTTTFLEENDNILGCRDNPTTTFFNEKNTPNNIYTCIKCNKVFSYRNSRNRYLKKYGKPFFL